MPESWVDIEAALIATTSYRCSGSSDMIVSTIWISLRRPLANDGRSGRSISRQVRIASSLGRPSRRKNEPGIRPTEYIRSSTSTVSGKKSKLLLGTLGRGGCRQHHGGVVEIGDGRAGCLTGKTPSFELDDAVAERPIVDNGFARVELPDPPRVLLFVEPEASSRQSPARSEAGLRSRLPGMCCAHARSATTEDRQDERRHEMWARRPRR